MCVCIVIIRGRYRDVDMIELNDKKRKMRRKRRKRNREERKGYGVIL